MSDLPPDVRTGLGRVVRQWPDWRTAPLVRLKNLLLDECGGDARPLITLVVRAAELGVPDRLLEWNRQGAPWSSVRGTIVVSLVSDAFLRPEMAAWVTDTWGAALFGGEALGLGEEVIPDLSPPRAGIAAARAAGGRVVPPPRPAGAASSVQRGRTPSRTVTAAAASAGGVSPKATSGGRPAATATPIPLIPSAAPYRAVLGVLALVIPLLLLNLVVRDRRGEATPPSADGIRGAGDGSTGDGAAGDGTNGVRRGRVAPESTTLVPGTVETQTSTLSQMSRAALPRAASDTSAMIFTPPPTRARGAVGAGAEILENSVARLQNSKADRIELRNGRMITGRVEVVRASAILFRDAESGLRYEIAKSEIKEITTEFGTKVRFNRDGDPTNERRSPLVTAGLAGTYLLRYDVTDVRGSAGCQRTQSASAQGDVMDIEHVPGADTLVLAVRNGSRWNAVVDKDGLFTSILALQPDQALTSSVYTSRIAGRFTSTGFDAEVVLISYRRMRVGPDFVCQTTIRTVGDRQVPAAPGPSRR